MGFETFLIALDTRAAWIADSSGDILEGGDVFASAFARVLTSGAWIATTSGELHSIGAFPCDVVGCSIGSSTGDVIASA